MRVSACGWSCCYQRHTVLWAAVRSCMCICVCIYACVCLLSSSQSMQGEESVHVSKKMKISPHAHILTLRVHSSGLYPHTQTTADRQLLDGSSCALTSLRECVFSKARLSLKAKRTEGTDEVLEDPIPLWTAAGLRSRLARVPSSYECNLLCTLAYGASCVAAPNFT